MNHLNHASGVKVNEVASWVGAGWSLMAGGSISRTILGLPDDDPTNSRGFFYNAFRDKSTLGSNPAMLTSELEQARDGNLDTEADLFAFNFNGNSGKFFFDAQGKYQIIPKQDLKILMHTSTYPNGRETIDKFSQDLITGFTIITPDGTKYRFDKIEQSPSGGIFFAITFHLTKISSYDAVNEIYFAYSGISENTSIMYDVRNPAISQRLFKTSSTDVTQHLGNICNSCEEFSDRYSQITDGYFTNLEKVREELLTTITTKSGNTTITFNQSNISYGINNTRPGYTRTIVGSREDVEYASPDNACTTNADFRSKYAAPYLASIDIKEGDFCHRKQLIYDYFKDARAQFQSKPWAKRLKLEEVKILEGTNCASPTNEIGSYKLNYVGDVVDANGNLTTRASMVHRLSRAIDHWGYYNGKIANDASNNLNNLNIPPTTVGSFTHGNSDRNSDEESMKQGILNKISYPTGGSTTFDYEANKVKTPTTDNIVCIDGDNNNTHNQRLFTVNSNSGNLGVLKLERKSEPTVACIITIFNANTGTSLWSADQTYTWLVGETNKEFPITLPTNLLTNVVLRITLQTYSVATFCIYKAQTSSELTVGGLRIKKTIFRPQVNDDNKIETNYQYTLNDASSSGVLLTGIPTYGYFNTLNGLPQPTGIPSGYFVPDVVMQSTPTSALGNYDGYHVAYKQVTVSQTNNGKNIYYYETESENTDKSFPVAPFQFRKNNGQLKSDETYKKDGSSDVLIGSSTYIPNTEGLNDANYSFKVVTVNSAIQSSLDNPNVWPTATCIYNGEIVPASNCSVAGSNVGACCKPCISVSPSSLRTIVALGTHFQKYKIKTSVYRLKSVTKVLDGVNTATENTYYTQADRTLSPITSLTTNSDGKQQKTTNKFIHEYNGSELAVNNGVDNTVLVSTNVKTWMLANNMISTPIETKIEYNNIVVGGNRIVFGFANSTGQYSSTTTTSNNVYPYKYYGFEPLTATFDANWQLKGSIDKYYTNLGLPQDFISKGYAQSEMYEWYNNSMLKKRIFSGLDWNYTYHTNSKLLSSIINENKIKSEFIYDNLMRLITIKSKFDVDGSNPKVTTSIAYNFGGTTAPNNNFVSTSTNFGDYYTANQTTKQYFDGLGRPISTVREYYTPNNYHQKSNITYDAIGRQDRAYQPFEGTQTNYETIDLSVARNVKPYTNPEYEASPLSRPVKQYTEEGTFMKMEYGTNNANYLVRQFTITTGTNGNFYTLSPVTTNSGNYSDNALYRITTWDENANTNEPKKGRADIFKDKIGRVILTRKFIKDANNVYKDVDTYNIYDDYSNLIMVVPPDVLDGSGNITAYTLIFQYKYDNQNRLCSKLIPGADAQELYYDIRDLVVLTQDGNQKVQNKLLATIYDVLGRTIKTGFVPTTTTGSTRSAIEAYINTNNGIPASAITDILTETSYVLNRSLVSQTKAKILGFKKAGDADFAITNYEFDAYARMNGTTGNSHLNKYNSTYFPQNNADKPTANFHSWIGTDDQYKASLQYNYYDNGLRPVSTYHSIVLDNTWSNITYSRLVSNLRYDEKDRLIEKNLGGIFDWNTWSMKYLQSLDYKFNNRNWLTTINEGYLPQTSLYAIPFPVASCDEINSWCGGSEYYHTPGLHVGDQNPDLFAEALRYDNPIAAYPGSTLARYNGDISQVVWQIAGREFQAYSYAYDELNRMIDANYTDIRDAFCWNTNSQQTYSLDNKYQEKVKYKDARGNIEKITRRGLDYPSSNWGVWCGTYNIIDDLTFNYNSKNQITTVAEDAPSWTAHKGFKYNASAGAYIYDENGNLKKDDHKNITAIEYNYLNLPVKVTFTNNRTIEFTYDATGKKWRKIVKEAGQPDKERDYIDGVEYSTVGSTISQDIIHFNEGYAQRDPSTDGNPSWQGWVYNYTIKDHLGNTRVVFDDFDNDGNVTTQNVKQPNNYYPFGMNMEGNWSGADGKFKYQYNGKEWNDKEFSDEVTGLGWNDYINRWYDPSMGRFSAIDAQAEKYPFYTQYQFAGNMPVRFVDLDGLEPKDGQRAWTTISESFKNTGWGLYTTSDNYYVAQQGQNYRYAKIGDTQWATDVDWKPTNYVNPENFVTDFQHDLRGRLPMLQIAAGFAQTSAQISTFGIAGFGLGVGGSYLGRGLTDAGIQLSAQTALNNGNILEGAANINVLESLGAAAGLPVGIQASFQANFSLTYKNGLQSSLLGEFNEDRTKFTPLISESQSNQQAGVGFIFGQGGDILFQAKNYKAAVFSTTLRTSVRYGGTIGLSVGSAVHTAATNGTAIVGEYLENKE